MNNIKSFIQKNKFVLSILVILAATGIGLMYYKSTASKPLDNAIADFKADSKVIFETAQSQYDQTGIIPSELEFIENMAQENMQNTEKNYMYEYSTKGCELSLTLASPGDFGIAGDNMRHGTITYKICY